ncbi:hypothetical protein [Acinetobacter radioresistens]|uniref:hypothetical protein n=1 Tax=Acinetobacter radioresistens TaxID=40216 RepID=UPI003B281AA6
MKNIYAVLILSLTGTSFTSSVIATSTADRPAPEAIAAAEAQKAALDYQYEQEHKSSPASSD